VLRERSSSGKRHDLEGVARTALDKRMAGLRDEYEVSCLELETLVDLDATVPGVMGARV